MGGLFGGGTKTEYVQSPEQRKVFNTIYPFLSNLMDFGLYNMGVNQPGTAATQPVGQPTYLTSAPYPSSLPEVDYRLDRDTRYTAAGYANEAAYKAAKRAEQEARQAWEAQQQAAQAATAPASGTGTVTSLGQPAAPYMPSMAGVLSDIPMYNIPTAVGPTEAWYGGLSPDVMAGVWAPYNEGAKQMLELMGGSTRGGYSGATGAALGKYFSDAATDVGLQAWNMSQPGLMANWQAELAANQMGYANLMQEGMTDYQNELARQQADYQSAMQAWQMPYSALGLIGGSYSTPVVQQQPGLLDIAGAAFPWAMMLGGFGPFGAAAGGAGAIGGMFGW